MTDRSTDYDLTQARAVIRAELEARAEEVRNEIAAILKRKNCHLRATVFVGGQPISVPVEVVAREYGE